MTITQNRQNSWLNFYHSSIGKKIITGITGLGLSLFVLVHMLGNLVYLGDRQSYNQLGHRIEGLSFLLYGIELILLASVIFHIAIGISIRLNSMKSRPTAYHELKSAGQPSKQSLSSRSMAITGLILLSFLVWHLLSFKFGTYYETTVEGVVVRDLARLVTEKFQSPLYTFGYVGCIALLGLHLRHGIWSAWQSLGVLNSRTSSFVYRSSTAIAILIAIGFMTLPLTIYFGIIG